MAGERGLVNIGRVITTWGNKGEVKVLSLSDFPDRFEGLKRVYLVKKEKPPVRVKIKTPPSVRDGRMENFIMPASLLTGQAKRAVTIENLWYHKGFIILKIKGYDSINQAKELKDSFLAIPKEERMKLKKGAYYFDDIIGLEVESETGEILGKIVDIIKNPSNDIYVIKNNKELWIPAIKEVVKKIDLENKKMIIHMIEGLESL